MKTSITNSLIILAALAASAGATAKDDQGRGEKAADSGGPGFAAAPALRASGV